MIALPVTIVNAKGFLWRGGQAGLREEGATSPAARIGYNADRRAVPRGLRGGARMTLSELRTKEVINVEDGRRLGRVMDIEFCVATSQVTALVVPADTSLIQTLRGEKCGTVIPWANICRIGDDVILVSLPQVAHDCG